MVANVEWVPENALWSLGLVVLSTLLTYLIGYSNGRRSQKSAEKLAAKNRIQTAKDRFGVFIQKHRSALPQRKVREFYESTKPAIRDSVSQVWHFLNSDDQRAYLDRLWREYDQIPAQEFDSKHEGAMGELARKLYRIAGAEFQSPYEILQFYLDEFYKFAA